MRYEVSETDFQLLTSVLTLLREKGGRNPILTRKEIVIASGINNSLMSKKILNSFKKEQQLKENIA